VIGVVCAQTDVRKHHTNSKRTKGNGPLTSLLGAKNGRKNHHKTEKSRTKRDYCWKEKLLVHQISADGKETAQRAFLVRRYDAADFRDSFCVAQKMHGAELTKQRESATEKQEKCHTAPEKTG